MNERSSSLLTQILFWVAIVGALNWGLVGFLNWDLVRAVFGGDSATDASALSRVIYALVGLAGIGLAILWPRRRAAGTTRELGERRAEARV